MRCTIFERANARRAVKFRGTPKTPYVGLRWQRLRSILYSARNSRQFTLCLSDQKMPLASQPATLSVASNALGGARLVDPNLLVRLAAFTEPETYDTTYLTHGIHPYAAKFIPQLPRLILQEHTNERHRVLDPFCGSGTTLLEAALLGRKSVGIDSHPIAALISRAKTTPLSEADLADADVLIARLKQLRPQDPKSAAPLLRDQKLRHWFAPPVIVELNQLRNIIRRVKSDALRTYLQCAFSGVIVGVSNQESETRYAAKANEIGAGETIERFAARLRKTLPKIRELSSHKSVWENRPAVYCSDVREAGSLLGDTMFDLVITSPPYPNSYDYYLYHKWRMWWLGFDISMTQTTEIGSRSEHSSKRVPIDGFVKKMHQALEPVANALKPSKLAYFFVGDSVIDGKFYDMREVYGRICEGLSLRLVDDAEYSLSRVSRSFREKTSPGCHGGAKSGAKMQRILVFEGIRANGATSGRVQATPRSKATAVQLSLQTPDKARVSLVSDDVSRHIHSLGRYPSKFIPEIPRWAIEEFSRRGATVMDPFAGSGTTAVEALALGRHAVAADFSPYSCLLTRAKTTWMKESDLSLAVDRLLDALVDPQALERPALRFELAEFWFAAPYLRQIEGIRFFIERRLPAPTRPFFLAVLSTVVRQCSYQDEGQVKVKRDPRKVLLGTPNPVLLMAAALKRNVPRLREYLALRDRGMRCEIICRSADNLVPAVIPEHSIDLIVTSPPYINAMNYPMTHRYENYLLRLITPQSRRRHEAGYFGSERVYVDAYRQYVPLNFRCRRVSELNESLARIHAEEPKRSYIARRFFEDMFRVVGDMRTALKPGGRLVLIAGRNTIRGVYIDTFKYISAIAAAHGFELQKQFDYEIIKNSFKLTRHATADIIRFDGVGVFQAPR